MSNWTTATLYKRFKEILSDEFDIKYDDLDPENVYLSEIDEKLRNRIVAEALGGETTATAKKPVVKVDEAV